VARYSLFVLKVPLNPNNQPINQSLCLCTDTQQFQTSPSSQSVVAESTVRLDCVTGYSAPPADIHWLHDGTPTSGGQLETAEFGSRRDGGAAGQRSSSLTLAGVSLDDQGFYECVAVNSASGRVVHSRSAYVNVTGMQPKGVKNGRVTMATKSCKNDATTLTCMNFSGHVGLVTILS